MVDRVRARKVWGIVIASVAVLIMGWAVSQLAMPWWSPTVAVAAHDRKTVSGDATGCQVAAPEVSLVEGQNQVRPYLGITYLPVTARVAPRYGLDVDWGVLVTAVAGGSPADRAGIRARDVVLFFEDQPLAPDVSFLDLLWRQQPGALVKLVVWRDGRHYTAKVTLR